LLAVIAVRPYDRAIMTRLFSALLVAFAMLCAPVTMGLGGGAMAHPATVAADVNCPGMSHSAPTQQKAVFDDNCAAACAAVVGLPAAVESETFLANPRLFAAAPAALTGISPEATAPPPRPAPAI